MEAYQIEVYCPWLGLQTHILGEWNIWWKLLPAKHPETDDEVSGVMRITEVLWRLHRSFAKKISCSCIRSGLTQVTIPAGYSMMVVVKSSDSAFKLPRFDHASIHCILAVQTLANHLKHLYLNMYPSRILWGLPGIVMLKMASVHWGSIEFQRQSFGWTRKE